MELDEAVKYVGAAYAVFVALLGTYLAIMALRMDRMRRELAELAELAETRGDGRRQTAASDEHAHEPAGVA